MHHPHTAIAVLPSKIGQIIDARKTLHQRGGSFRAKSGGAGHVVLCGENLNESTVEDCLYELHDASVRGWRWLAPLNRPQMGDEPPFLVILSPTPASSGLERLLRQPLFECGTIRVEA